MSVPLSFTLPTSSQWQLMDWTDPVKKSPAAVGGTMQVQFDDLGFDELWLIERAVIQCDSTTDTKLRLYASSATPENLLSGSDSDASVGNFDEAEYPRGLLLRPSRSLLAVWTGASAGSHGTIRLQAQVFRKVTG
jgi:hypothetical protein